MDLRGHYKYRYQNGNAGASVLRWLSLLGPCSLATALFGQSVLVPPPGFQEQSPSAGFGMEYGKLPENQSALESIESTIAAPIQGALAWGELHLHPHLSYEILYGTGVQFEPGQKANTLTQTFSPGVSATLGSHWMFDYTPSFRFFSDRNFRDTLDHSLALNGSTSYGNWRFGLSQDYTATDEPLIETGSQTQQQSYSAGASASYDFNSKWSETTSASANLTFLGNSAGAQPLTGTQDYLATQMVHYQPFVPLTIGAGCSIGYSEQAVGFNSIDQQYFGNVNWVPGEKLSISLNAGVENQTFLSSGSHSSDLNPIFGISVAYHIIEPTTLTLAANRTVGASLYQNQNNESTQVNASIEQRLLHRALLSLSFGYTTADYTDITGGFATVRTDDGYSFNVALSFGFLKHAAMSAFYAYGHNSSNLSQFGYSSNQTGATLTWTF